MGGGPPPRRGRAAAELGLVHAVVPSDYVEREAVAWIRAVSGRLNRGPYSHSGRGFAGHASRYFPPFPAAFFSLVRRQTAKRVRPQDYPAPFKAIAAIE